MPAEALTADCLSTGPGPDSDFSADELAAMSADPCYFGYHLWDSDDPDYEGLLCARGCGFGIG